MELIKYPDPRLLRSCKEVSVFGEELRVLLESMWEIMEKERGIGLAANQVGLEYRMFIMKGPNKENIFLINPKILEYSSFISSASEGCLSFPGLILKLDRPNWVKVSFQDLTGQTCIKIFSGIHSTCVFHEMEHLDGKVFIQNDKIPKKTRISLEREWKNKT